MVGCARLAAVRRPGFPLLLLDTSAAAAAHQEIVVSLSSVSRTWREVSRDNPCPVCKKSSWCKLSGDGAVVLCRRQEAGCYRSKLDQRGAPYYLHRADGETQHVATPPPEPANPKPKRADPDVLDRVYTALLAKLQLSNAHRENLHQRGLTDEIIDRIGYQTLPRSERPRIASSLKERFGDVLLQVPGFVIKEWEGRSCVTIAGAAGLLVPVRDLQGRIVALKIRRDAADDRRYSYLSSVRFGGPGPSAPVHVPLGIQAPAAVVRVTEGELKADVAFARSGLPTVSVPGVGNWAACLPVLVGLDCKTVRLAFDADARIKPAVAQAILSAATRLADEGYGLELEVWSPQCKGIDDLLAVGGTPNVLMGDAVREAVQEIAQAAGVKTPTREDAFIRLPGVLAQGAAALFEDRPLLEALARVAVDDPARFAGLRATIRKDVSVRDLDKALKPFLREQTQKRPPALHVAGYRVENGCLCREHATPQGGITLVPLANFAAKIVQQIVRDDGVERRTTLVIEGRLQSGQALPRVEVGAETFTRMDWPMHQWGTQAVVYAGAATRDHVRTALQILSTGVARQTVYTHTGWRKIGDASCYLHAAGAIGPHGPVADLAVELPSDLARYVLPQPPAGEALRQAIAASLNLLELGPDSLTFSMQAACYRAVLGEVDFAVHLCGPTGCFKSESVALWQQHYGAGMTRKELPANWLSTGNALERIAFAAKDAVLVVDDFAPSGSAAEVQRLHHEADRLLRAQGNHAGRQRMNRDGSLRASRPPRGLVVSTGEDVPRGQSLQARLFTIEVQDGDVDARRLTACQQDAAEGLYAQAMAGFIQWLAPQLDMIHARLRSEVGELRAKVLAQGQHARTPEIVANLAIGLRYLLGFARAVGALSKTEQEELWQRGWQSLVRVADAQAGQQAASEPVGRFLRLLAASVASGRAHLAGPDGNKPARNAQAWGWRREDFTAPGSLDQGWRSQGKRAGWIDGENVYLQPDEAYAVAQHLAVEQGEGLGINPRTLHVRLKQQGLLASWDKTRQRNTVRRTLEGLKGREVLHVRASSLASVHTGPSTPSTKVSNPYLSSEAANASAVDGPVDGFIEAWQQPSMETVHPSSQNHQEQALGGRYGRSDTGVEASRTEDFSPAEDTRPVYAQLPNGRIERIHSLDRLPPEAVAWCREGDSAWRSLNGAAG